MQGILIAFTILLYSLQTLFCTLYNNKYKKDPDLATPVFCVLQGLAISLFTFVWMAFDIEGLPDSFRLVWKGFHFNASPITLLLGALNALAAFGYNFALIKASAKGSYAFLNVMMLFGGILIPAVYATTVDGPLQGYHYVAIGAMLVAFVLMNYKDIQLKGTPLVYYLFCILLFVCNGLYGTFLKMQDVYMPAEKNEMIIITYGLTGVIGLVQLVMKKKGDTLDAFKMGKQAALPLAACLTISSVAVNMYIIIISLVNVTILYTLDNGGVLVLSAIYSFLLFKEKPHSMKLIGLIIATLSIITLSLNADSIAFLTGLFR